MVPTSIPQYGDMVMLDYRGAPIFHRQPYQRNNPTNWIAPGEEHKAAELIPIFYPPISFHYVKRRMQKDKRGLRFRMEGSAMNNNVRELMSVR